MSQISYGQQRSNTQENVPITHSYICNAAPPPTFEKDERKETIVVSHMPTTKSHPLGEATTAKKQLSDLPHHQYSSLNKPPTMRYTFAFAFPQ